MCSLLVLQLKSLRLEIERRMVSSVGSEQTVSSEPVPLTVRGPHMKRMVLVDLPGVISVSKTLYTVCGSVLTSIIALIDPRRLLPQGWLLTLGSPLFACASM